MNHSFGIDPRAAKSNLASCDRSEKQPRILSVSSLSESESGGSPVWSDSRVSIVIDDQLADVRVVRPAIVDPHLAKIAAEHEARTALLGDNSDLLIEVNQIGNPDDPRAWLAVSFHESATKAAMPHLGTNIGDLSPRFIPRSIALGKGFLHLRDTDPAESTALVTATAESTSICYIGRGVVIGRTWLKGIDIGAVDDTTIKNWLSEIEMVTKYRLSTDLRTLHGPSACNFKWIGDQSMLERINAIGSVTIESVIPKARQSSPSEEVSWPLESCAAVGAALN